MKFVLIILIVLFALIVETYASHGQALQCAGCLAAKVVGCIVTRCGPPVPTPIWVECEADCLADTAAGDCSNYC